jgi:ParB family chromosome partitioning protein
MTHVADRFDPYSNQRIFHSDTTLEVAVSRETGEPLRSCERWLVQGEGEQLKPRRLGRGLDFLLSSGSETQEQSAVEEIDVAAIETNPWQPRSQFKEDELESLTDSIRRHGVVQPIVVRRAGESGYQLIAGERRLIASKRAGLARIPAVVRAINDADMLVVALVENIQRADLGATERARAFQRLVMERGLTHDEIAGASGLARSTVTNSIRLLDLDEGSMVALESGQISEGHARALLGEPDLARRQQLLRRMLDEKMSVRTIEDQLTLDRPTAPSRRRGKGSADARLLERQLAEALGLKVTIQERGTGGRLVIKYSSLEEFDRLYKKLTGKKPSESELKADG